MPTKWPNLDLHPHISSPKSSCPWFFVWKTQHSSVIKKKETGNWSYLKNGGFGLKLMFFCLKKLQFFHSLECAIVAPKSCQKRQKKLIQILHLIWGRCKICLYDCISELCVCVWKQTSKKFQKARKHNSWGLKTIWYWYWKRYYKRKI